MERVIVKQLSLGPMANFTYLVGDPETRYTAVIDPGWEAMEIIHAAMKEGLLITKILLTHTHFDHSGAVEEFEKFTNATVFVSSAEVGEITKAVARIETEDGKIIEVGKLKIKCLATPGHTPGSQCFLVEDALFTGDTLFVDGCGRVDLPGSDSKEMLVSLKRIAMLDGNITIYPGHDYGPKRTATIAEQLKTNPYLGRVSEAMLL